MVRLNTLFIVLILGAASANAQHSLTGYTFDVVSGKPLEGIELALHDGLSSRSSISNEFGRYAFDSLGTGIYSIVGAFRLRVSGEPIRVYLRVEEFEPQHAAEEMYFGFSPAEVEALIYMSQHESKGNAVNSPAMDIRTDSLFQKSYVRNKEGSQLLSTISWRVDQPPHND